MVFQDPSSLKILIILLNLILLYLSSSVFACLIRLNGVNVSCSVPHISKSDLQNLPPPNRSLNFPNPKLNPQINPILDKHNLFLLFPRSLLPQLLALKANFLAKPVDCPLLGWWLRLPLSARCGVCLSSIAQERVRVLASSRLALTRPRSFSVAVRICTAVGGGAFCGSLSFQEMASSSTSSITTNKVCYCGFPLVQLTVEGRLNYGRRF